MDSLRAARYPFLRESAEFAESNSADIESLISSPSYEDARKRGMQRVLDAIDKHTISDRSLLQQYDRLMEVLSYPYARMLVSCINDRYLTKRYALAEGVRMNFLLHNDPESNVIVAQELEIKSSIDPDGRIAIHFGNYLRYSCVLKAIEWKLINMDLRKGYVHLDPEKFDRLIQTALQERIEAELPLKMPDEFQRAIRKDVEHVAAILAENKVKLSPTGGRGMELEYLPPCIRTILANAQNGMNLPHSARFALVSFLHALGVSYDGIITLFSQSPDFDESKSSYQIKHITGELSGGDGYTPPECSTMKTNGICYNPDELCNRKTVNHPLTYYRIKSGNFIKKEEEKKE
ncbi:MAG: DNA primase large subunit PriL [Candidatus Methanomethylophilaceae archaeon]|nr:DNA primase large subunit PriL [Candidatus Methanomethylophilaceae archaeon]